MLQSDKESPQEYNTGSIKGEIGNVLFPCQAKRRARHNAFPLRKKRSDNADSQKTSAGNLLVGADSKGMTMILLSSHNPSVKSVAGDGDGYMRM